MKIRTEGGFEELGKRRENLSKFFRSRDVGTMPSRKLQSGDAKAFARRTTAPVGFDRSIVCADDVR
jgi:hypothetical protein